MAPIAETLAQQLAESLRGEDIVCRGPDQVLWVLLPGTNEQNTVRVLRRLLDNRSLHHDGSELALRSGYAAAPEGLRRDETADPLMTRLQAQVTA